MDFNISVIKGDGIGPEIIDATIPVLEKIGKEFSHRFKFEYLLAGGAALDDSGHPLPKKTIKKCKDSDAVLLGAVGDPKWDNNPFEKTPEAAILGLREELELFANLRPAIVYNELASACPLKEEIIEGGIDLLIVRELTGGIYFGKRGTEVIGEASKFGKFVDNIRGEKTLPPGRYAYDVEQYTEFEIKRIAKVAFKMALKRNRILTSVDKANVLDSSRLWRAIMDEMHVKYSKVKLDHMYVDNAAQQLIKNPRQFDVIVTSNMFGDILSDEASQITGSIGMLPSASLGFGSFGLYEPIHGSAPKYAGLDRANPVATILSAAMMLRYSLDLMQEADAVEKAVSKWLAGGYRTADIMSEGMIPSGTKECGRQIAEFIGKEA